MKVGDLNCFFVILFTIVTLAVLTSKLIFFFASLIIIRNCYSSMKKKMKDMFQIHLEIIIVLLATNWVTSVKYGLLTNASENDTLISNGWPFHGYFAKKPGVHTALCMVAYSLQMFGLLAWSRCKTYDNLICKKAEQFREHVIKSKQCCDI